jgi:ribonuclease Z
MLPFSVTILGSSSALPTSSRFTTSQVVGLNEKLYLIDCGEGTQIQLRKYGIKVGKINHIFISHLHGDHIFGLPGLISTIALGGKKGELHIYSHSELKIMMDHFLKFMNDFVDLKIPIKDRVAIKRGADYQVPGGVIIPNKDLTFPPDPARAYAFVTDTVYRKQIIPVIKDVDLLYHEATFSDELSELALKTCHSTAKQAATIAGEAGV